MILPYYQVDAFATKPFTGNPAGVVILNNWIDKDLMQKIAFENNLAETAFIVPDNGEYGLRWFTPTVEVDLCGHATLASAFVLKEFYNEQSEVIVFNSIRSGILTVKKEGDLYRLDFPLDDVIKSDDPVCTNTLLGLGAEPVEAYTGKTDCMLIFESEEQIAGMKPDNNYLKKVGGRGVIVTASGTDYDYVYRFFAPQSGIDEDPATGSAQTTLLTYWSKQKDKKELHSKQLSQRGGYFKCHIENDRAKIAGKAILYQKGEIYI